MEQLPEGEEEGVHQSASHLADNRVPSIGGSTDEVMPNGCELGLVWALSLIPRVFFSGASKLWKAPQRYYSTSKCTLQSAQA